MNEPERFLELFDGIAPWSEPIPHGFAADFLGTLISRDFLVGGEYFAAGEDGRAAEPPRIDVGANAEPWFEIVNWLLAVKDARERFTMLTLGANYGYQAVGCWRALNLLNPLPAKLVAVDPVPENIAWIKRHMRDNGIDPDEHCVIQAVVSDNNDPVFFPVGSPGLGAQNCIATNDPDRLRQYVADMIEAGGAETALNNLILHNTTGLKREIIAGGGASGEIKLVSAVTLADILGPLDRVDLLEADMQESGIVVFPAFRALTKRKVHRIALGTHGREVHQTLHRMFADDGWDIVFSYEPDSRHLTALGAFETNDGILSLRNPEV